MSPTQTLPNSTKRKFEAAVYTHLGMRFPEGDPVWCDSRETIITGGWRAGKSTRGAGRVLRQILQPIDYGLIWLLGPDYMQTGEEFRYLREWTQKLKILAKSNEPSDGQKTLKTTTGWTIQTKSARYPEKLGSVAPSGIVLCEGGQMPEEVYVMCTGRLAEKRGWLFATGTLEGDDGHPRWLWYEDFAREWADHGEQEDARAFSLPSWTNPIVYPLGRNDPEILRQEERLSEYEFLRYIAGVPVGVQYPCFPLMWETGHDYIATPNSTVFTDGAIGVDWGQTDDHPCAACVVRMDNNGRYWMTELWIERQGNLQQLELVVEGMKRRYNITRGRVDPHQDPIAQRLNFNTAIGGSERGIPTEYRIGLANSLLQDGYLYFDKRGKGIVEDSQKGLYSVYNSMRLMRRIRSTKGRLMYERPLGDDAAMAALYAIEELRDTTQWLPQSTNFGGMKFGYLTQGRAGMVGRS